MERGEKMREVFLLLLTVIILGLVACGNEEDGAGSGSNKNNGDDRNRGADGICAEQDIGLKLSGVKVMLLVDFSQSMNTGNKWDAATEAIESMVTDPANQNTEFGLHVFPKPGMLSGCQAAFAPAVEIGPNNAAAIVEWMKTHKPGTFSVTPLVEALKYYLGVRETPMHDPETSNYIVVLSDGADSCYGNALQTFTKSNMIAGVVDDLKDISGIKTVAVGFGNDAAKGQLNAIAKHGGSSFGEYIPAKDGATLTAALKEIAASIRPCRYLIDAPDAEIDSSKVNFYFDDKKVDRDRTHQNGWDWTKNEDLEVEFFGEACRDIQDEKVTNVNATFGCPTQIDGETCATHDAFLRFPGVGVTLLLDVSSSMFQGNKWKAATTAITNMLVDDRNNYVEFGFDPFPSSNQCDISPSPEIPIGGPETRLMIIEWITMNSPAFLGGTPLAQAMRRLLNRPGGIERKDVSGVVIAITDGADTCASSKVTSLPEQLSQVTEELVSRHNARVFAIGFGAGVNENQLNAIARAGGTGLMNYQKANDSDELDDVLNQISSMVTSCVFDVPYAGPEADYNQVNFYFDGKAVPRDPSNGSGWNWTNEVTKENVEFFGEFCEQLKKGDVKDVVVEFGCEPLIVI